MAHEALQNCPLFSQISPAYIDRILTVLHATEQTYPTDTVLVHAGSSSSRLGIVLSGDIEAWRTGMTGSEFLSAHMTCGGVFGDLMAACGTESPVTVRTGSISRILWISYPALPALFSHSTEPAFQEACTMLLRNLIFAMATKYFALDRRLEILTLPSLRDKILYYLSHCLTPASNGGRTIPFSQSVWADYMHCDRSALSRELSRMRADGVIRTEKRTIWLCTDAPNEGETP